MRDRLKRINSGQSMLDSPRIPLSFIPRVQSIASAAPTSTFLGSQPRKAQVPPNGRESTIATFQPAERQRCATAEAPEPVPIATRSNFSVMISWVLVYVAQHDSLATSLSK